MNRHTLDFYMDGHKAIEFCKLCGAEDQQLLDQCQGKIPLIMHCKEISKEEFEKIYPKPVDSTKDKT